MEAGRLNLKCSIYARNLAVDEYGSQLITYSKVCDTRCNTFNVLSKSTIRGYVQTINNEVVYVAPLSIWLRSYVPITEHCVIKINDTFYAIDSYVENKVYNRIEVIGHSVDDDIVII